MSFPLAMGSILRAHIHPTTLGREVNPSVVVVLNPSVPPNGLLPNGANVMFADRSA
jgi:hypothetical protein